MIKRIRMRSQQLEAPRFDTPRQLVSWMGAMQGQDYVMSQWAVGLRLKRPSLTAVQEALRNGEILRTHIMRPTWHLVAAEDIRWILPLTADRLRKAFESYVKGSGVTVSEADYQRGNELIHDMLVGGNARTKAEIAERLSGAGLPTENNLVNTFLFRGEVDGLICSGPDKGNKVTYALLDERVPAQAVVTREEALARLAERYFRSHSPATLQDFSWWSGLSLTEAREAMGYIRGQLVTDRLEAQEMLVHESCQEAEEKGIVHLMPSYDEYLISYKDRSPVLDLQHCRQAYTPYGIFYPVLLRDGRIVGNWKKTGNGAKMKIDHTLFPKEKAIGKAAWQKAVKRYEGFLKG